MDAAEITKTFRIEYNVITGALTTYNDDEMSYIEILGALEYAKMMVAEDWRNND